jgi:TonB family protein
MRKSVFICLAKAFLCISLVGLVASCKTQKQTSFYVERELPQDSICYEVDKAPSFLGGSNGMSDYISSHLEYPLDAWGRKKEGTVEIGYAIDAQGRIRNVKLLKSVYPSLDKESMRVIKSFPKFEPAIKDGKPVAFGLRQPFLFQMSYEKKKPEKSDTIATNVEKLPEFEGGHEGLSKYIAKNIDYPEDAIENNIQGTVRIRCIVDAEGNVLVDKGVYPSLDQEAVRIVSALPKFKPATQDGHAVMCWYIILVEFKLN